MIDLKIDYNADVWMTAIDNEKGLAFGLATKLGYPYANIEIKFKSPEDLMKLAETILEVCQNQSCKESVKT